jgi:hypothetical protein
MSNGTDRMTPSDPSVAEPPTERLKHDIEQTKEGLSETLSALEEKLSPSQIREVVGSELEQVEQRVRVVLADQLDHAKAAVRDEMGEAKIALREGLQDAERMLRSGLADAKESVKTELQDAVTGAKESLRAASLGRVEDFATKVGDTMNEARDTLLDTLYNNPLPTTVAGVGLAWLLMNRSRSAANRTRGSNGQGGATVGRVAQRASGAVSQGVQGATDVAGNALHGASELVTSVAHTATEGVQQAAQVVTDSAQSLAGTAQYGAKRVERTVQRALQERPLAIGAAALAIGTVVGCSLPGTSAENELMGEARDNVLSRAGDAVHEAASKISEPTQQDDAKRPGNTGQGGRHDENGSASHAS